MAPKGQQVHQQAPFTTACRVCLGVSAPLVTDSGRVFGNGEVCLAQGADIIREGVTCTPGASWWGYC